MKTKILFYAIVMFLLVPFASAVPNENFWYKFNDDVLDETGKADLDTTGSLTFVEGKLGNAIECSEGNYPWFNENFNNSAHNGVTMAFWLKGDHLDVGQMIFETDVNKAYRPQVLADERLRAGYHTSGGYKNGHVSTSGNTGWTHYVLAAENNNRIGIYVNGVFTNTTVTVTGLDTPSDTAYFCRPEDELLNGLINPLDDFRFYLGVYLGQTEVDALYNSGNGINISLVQALAPPPPVDPNEQKFTIKANDTNLIIVPKTAR
jgi:hypothetical protein